MIASLLTVAAVAGNVAWFARRGLGPGALVQEAIGLWAAVAAFLLLIGAGAWLAARIIARLH